MIIGEIKKRKPLSEEHKRNLSIAHKGQVVSEETRKKMREARKGKQPTLGMKFSEEHKRKIGLKSKGNKYCLGKVPWNKGKKGVQVGANKGKNFSEEWRKNLSLAHKGYVRPEDQRKKMSQYVRKGEAHYAWKGGITPIYERIRKSLEYRLWREAVFKRDNWTCVWCGKRGGVLHSDHIKPFSLYPALRFAIDNGRTLCMDCHKKTDTFGWKGALWS